VWKAVYDWDLLVAVFTGLWASLVTALAVSTGWLIVRLIKACIPWLVGNKGCGRRPYMLRRPFLRSFQAGNGEKVKVPGPAWGARRPRGASICAKGVREARRSEAGHPASSLDCGVIGELQEVAVLPPAVPPSGGTSPASPGDCKLLPQGP
jgi:hypothetical protein